MTNTTTNSTSTRSARLIKAMDRVAAVASYDGKREAREEAAQLRAVKAGLDAYLTRAPLADRHALLDTIAKMVGERSAERIRAYAEAMKEWKPPAPAGGAAPVETIKVESAAKPTKEDDKAA